MTVRESVSPEEAIRYTTMPSPIEAPSTGWNYKENKREGGRERSSGQERGTRRRRTVARDTSRGPVEAPGTGWNKKEKREGGSKQA